MRPFDLYSIVGEQASFSVAMHLGVVGTVFSNLSPKCIEFPPPGKSFSTWNLNTPLLQSSSTKMRSHSTPALFLHVKMFSDPIFPLILT